MKIINRKLCMFLVFLLSIGSGVFFSFKNAPQEVKENQKEVLALIDKFGTAIRFAILQVKMPPITIASASRVQNYRDEPPTNDWHAGFSYTWGDNVELTHEVGVGVRESDWYGRYREVGIKQSGNGTCERTYSEGYEHKMDETNDHFKASEQHKFKEVKHFTVCSDR